jgi:hypothetical protein
MPWNNSSGPTLPAFFNTASAARTTRSRRLPGAAPEISFLTLWPFMPAILNLWFAFKTRGFFLSF